MNTEDVVPFGMKKKYNISRLKTVITDDIYKYATERSHNLFKFKRHWLVKHCHVWKNLYRRDLISDIKFIEGILFEDFPWWSEVLLKNPRTTIVNLPLYFYRPNFNGIVLSAKQIKIMESLFVGLDYIFKKYKQSANDYQMKKWSENFLWFFIARAYDKTQYLNTNAEFKVARDGFAKLAKLGVFDNVPNEWRKLRRNIYAFIKGTK